VSLVAVNRTRGMRLTLCTSIRTMAAQVFGPWWAINSGT